MTRGKDHPPEVRDRILETLRVGVPFIALAAEANGISRKTMEVWMTLGQNGDPRYEDFATQVREIRSKFMLKHALELLSADQRTAEGARQRNWLLQRLDRDLFDLPKAVYEKLPARTSPAQHATLPTAASPAAVAQALEDLSKPLTEH